MERDKYMNDSDKALEIMKKKIAQKNASKLSSTDLLSRNTRRVVGKSFVRAFLSNPQRFLQDIEWQNLWHVGKKPLFVAILILVVFLAIIPPITYLSFIWDLGSKESI